MTRTTYAGTSCPRCGSAEVLRLALTVAAHPVVFESCNTCDWKRWARDGEDLGLGNVLELIAPR